MRQPESELDGLKKAGDDGRYFLLRWIAGTAVAWIAGMLLGFLLAGLMTELLSLVLGQPYDNMAGNIILGFILGTAVGWGQRFMLRRQIALPAWWFLMPGLLLAAGYTLLELGLLIIGGDDTPPPVPLWSLLQTILYALAGGLSGLLQSRVWPRRWSWPAANALGWGGALALIQQLTTTQAPGALGFILFLSGLILSGLLLGTTSGLALRYDRK